MSATIKLDSVRFVKRVTNGASMSKYGYIGMMEQLADAIMSAPWAEASAEEVTLTTNQITKTDGVFDDKTGTWTTPPTYTAYMGQEYDTFAQAGDGVARNATMCGYMGCVAYRFAIPPSESANTLQAVKLSLQRERYLRAVVRVGMQISSSETPSDDWSVIRGEATGCVRSASAVPGEGVVGVESFGLLGQTDVPNVVSSYAAAAMATFDTSANFTGLTSATYLFVYVTLEDPAAHWTMYNETERRQYFIEGSAMLIAESCAFTFASEPSWTYGEQDEYGICLTAPYRTGGGNYFQLGGGDYPSTGLLIKDGNVAWGSIRYDHPIVATDICLPGGYYVTDEDVTIPFKSKYPETASKPTGGILGWRGIVGAYTDFFADAMIRCAYKGVTYSPYPAAAFYVGDYWRDVPSGSSSNLTQQYNGFGVFMSRKKLLIPFLIPKGFLARGIRLDWQNILGNFVYGPPAFQHNVWIAEGRNIEDYGSATLQRHELWTAETGVVGEYSLVGSWNETYDSGDEGTISAPTHTKTLYFSHPIKSTFNTLLLTVYTDFSSFNLVSAPANVTESCNPLSAGYCNWSSSESEITVFYKGGSIYGGWSPAITLLGTQG